MPDRWDFTYGDENLNPEETSIIAAHANGRALEFGSGRGLGTYALLAGRSTYILSIDEDEDYTAECSVRYIDPRVDWAYVQIDSEGWYKPNDMPPLVTPFDTVLLDGPAGLPGRGLCLPMLLDGNYLAPGWRVLVTHTGQATVKQFLKTWVQKYPIKRETIRCDRGMVRITAV